MDAPLPQTVPLTHQSMSNGGRTRQQQQVPKLLPDRRLNLGVRLEIDAACRFIEHDV